MDAAAFCARWDRRAVSEESVSDQQRADERRLLRTAKSCGPDAPTLASSSRSCVGPTGFRQNLALRMTVAKEPGHPAFPTPSKRAEISCTTRAQRAARS